MARLQAQASCCKSFKIPPVDHYIAGYIAGAKAADPKVKELNDYSNSFTDTAKCSMLR